MQKHKTTLNLWHLLFYSLKSIYSENFKIFHQTVTGLLRERSKWKFSLQNMFCIQCFYQGGKGRLLYVSVLLCTSLYFLVFRCNPLYFIVLHCTSLYFSVSLSSKQNKNVLLMGTKLFSVFWKFPKTQHFCSIFRNRIFPFSNYKALLFYIEVNIKKEKRTSPYFWVLLGTFRYFSVLLCTSRYFCTSEVQKSCLFPLGFYADYSVSGTITHSCDCEWRYLDPMQESRMLLSHWDRTLSQPIRMKCSPEYKWWVETACYLRWHHFAKLNS
jgi:hypothetical protein